jgi:hypothetical protein
MMRGSTRGNMNPDSAVEIETNVGARCKPGAAKTSIRIVSRSSLVLGPPLRCVSRDDPMHPKPSVC